MQIKHGHVKARMRNRRQFQVTSIYLFLRHNHPLIPTVEPVVIPRVVELSI
jgi:hypothetical protein